jgi:soluble lytic murein transglycosylase-like protein
VKDVFAAEQNLLGGAAYMRLLMNQFSNDLSLALAAYNAGEGAVMRAGRRIPAFPETQHYVRKVLARLASSADPAVPPRR